MKYEPWIYDVVMALMKWSTEHPKLHAEYFDADAKAFVMKRVDACGCEALEHVPAEFMAGAAALRGYLRHARLTTPHDEGK